MCVNFAVLLAMDHQSAAGDRTLEPLTRVAPLTLPGTSAPEQVLATQHAPAAETAEQHEAFATEPSLKQQILEFDLIADASDDLYDVPSLNGSQLEPTPPRKDRFALSTRL